MRKQIERFFDSNEQTQAVIHTVLALTLLLSGLALFCYGITAEARNPLRQILPLNYVLISFFFGAYALSMKFTMRKRLLLQAISGLVICISAIDGWFGETHLYAPFDTGLNPVVYPVTLFIFTLVVLSEKWPRLKPLQVISGIITVSFFVAIYINHFILEQPLLAKHPAGSNIATVLTLVMGALVANLGKHRWQSWTIISQRTLLVTLATLTLLMLLSVGLFRSEMAAVEQQGAQAAQSHNNERVLISTAGISMVERVVSRWQRYPVAEQRDLIHADVVRQVNDVPYLKSMIMLDPQNRVRWEVTQDQSPSMLYLLEANQRLADTLAQQPAIAPQRSQIYISEPSYSPSGLLLLVRMPFTITELDGQKTPKSIIAVIDTVEMFSVLTADTNSLITTYTKYLDRYWVNQYGQWLTATAAQRLDQRALLLFEEKVDGVNSSGIPMRAYLTDSSALQRVSNLQSTIIVGGIVVVLLLALALERNRRILSQGKQLRFQAEHDALTGLRNRASFEKQLATHFRDHADLSILFIDLDGFTLVNDSLGLQVGDRLLQLVAARLTHVVGAEALLARFSSDEFICLVSGYRDKPLLLERLNQAILDTVAQPFKIMQHRIYVTASIGVAHRSAEMQSPFELVQRADMAMHEAKQLGNNHVQLYQASMSEQFSHLALLRSELQEAIENQGLSLHFQPIVRCADQQVVTYEALLRWQKANGEFVSPADFIPLAEKTGQIIPLSEWVFKQACQAAADLQQQGRDCRVAVNLSTMQFNRSYFVDFVLKAAAQAGCRPEWLELELTESILLENLSSALAVVKRLRSEGFSIALDDFGTGFSSLSYLKQLPIDKVKIDRSFIAGIGSHQSDQVLIESVIRIAQSLHFSVTAEGVETQQQADFVTALGCDYMQGYLFGRPAPELK